ncbi:MAG: sulfur carrier protein ThiS [Thiohalomonadaceae bacterium]
MKIYVNGEAREVPENHTAAELVKAMGLAGKRIAMEINMEIVPRSQYDSHHFQNDDKVEIVQAIGGG